MDIVISMSRNEVTSFSNENDIARASIAAAIEVLHTYVQGWNQYEVTNTERTHDEESYWLDLHNEDGEFIITAYMTVRTMDEEKTAIIEVSI